MRFFLFSYISSITSQIQLDRVRISEQLRRLEKEGRLICIPYSMNSNDSDEECDSGVCSSAEGSSIGSGGNASVYTVFVPALGIFLACKKATTGFNGVNHGVIREMNVLMRLNHPNIIKFYGVSAEGPVTQGMSSEPPRIYMEYVPGTTLSNATRNLRRQGLRWAERDIARYVYDLLSAIIHLHRSGLIHLDIKPDNVMVSSEGRLVIIDMGSCLTCDLGKTIQSGSLSYTVPYAAPEVLQAYEPLRQSSSEADFGPIVVQLMDHRVDVWSLGCLAVSMMHMDPVNPWAQATLPNEHDISFITRSPAAGYFPDDQQSRYPVPYRDFLHDIAQPGYTPDPIYDPCSQGDDLFRLSPLGHDFLRQCFTRTYTFRPQAADLLLHPWFKACGVDRPPPDQRARDALAKIADLASSIYATASDSSLPHLLPESDRLAHGESLTLMKGKTTRKRDLLQAEQRAKAESARIAAERAEHVAKKAEIEGTSQACLLAAKEAREAAIEARKAAECVFSLTDEIVTNDDINANIETEMDPPVNRSTVYKALVDQLYRSVSECTANGTKLAYPSQSMIDSDLSSLSLSNGSNSTNSANNSAVGFYGHAYSCSSLSSQSSQSSLNSQESRGQGRDQNQLQCQSQLEPLSHQSIPQISPLSKTPTQLTLSSRSMNLDPRRLPMTNATQSLVPTYSPARRAGMPRTVYNQYVREDSTGGVMQNGVIVSQPHTLALAPAAQQQQRRQLMVGGQGQLYRETNAIGDDRLDGELAEFEEFKRHRQDFRAFMALKQQSQLQSSSNSLSSSDSTTAFPSLGTAPTPPGSAVSFNSGSSTLSTRSFNSSANVMEGISSTVTTSSAPIVRETYIDHLLRSPFAFVTFTEHVAPPPVTVFKPERSSFNVGQGMGYGEPADRASIQGMYSNYGTPNEMNDRMGSGMRMGVGMEAGGHFSGAYSYETQVPSYMQSQQRTPALSSAAHHNHMSGIPPIQSMQNRDLAGNHFKI